MQLLLKSCNVWSLLPDSGEHVWLDLGRTPPDSARSGRISCRIRLDPVESVARPV
jgi:hypothetical protein